VNGRELNFYLAGINNQNFLMRDKETGSYWQQVSGRAVSGPMRGAVLELVSTVELSFGLWKQEQPQGKVMMGNPKWGEDYERGWEQDLKRLPTVVKLEKSALPDRETVLGMEWKGGSRAYPLAKVLEQKVVQDRIGNEPVVLVAGPDGESVRAFRSGKREFFRKDGRDFSLMDSVDGTEWDFRGCNARGECLEPIGLLKDFWFDWQLYHPGTSVYEH
jgi:hypothetical protein